jgi:hypothetical protein
LTKHRDELERVTAELMKDESMDGETFYRLIGREQPHIGAENREMIAGNLTEVNQHAG